MLVSDIGMPEENGYELIRVIQRESWTYGRINVFLLKGVPTLKPAIRNPNSNLPLRSFERMFCHRDKKAPCGLAPTLL
jgi:hypothetical protein